MRRRSGREDCGPQKLVLASDAWGHMKMLALVHGSHERPWPEQHWGVQGGSRLLGLGSEGWDICCPDSVAGLALLSLDV